MLLTAQPARARRSAEKPVSFINDVAPDPQGELLRLPRGQEPQGQARHDQVRNASARAAPRTTPSSPASRTTAISSTSSTATDTTRMPPKEAATRCPRTRSPSSSAGSRRAPSSTPASTSQGRPAARAAHPLEAADPAGRLPVPGHDQRAGLHAGQQEARRRRPSRADRLGRRPAASWRSASTPAAGGRWRWCSCPTASWPSPAAGPARRATCASTTSTAARRKIENGVAVLDGVNDKGVMVKQLLDADDEVLCLAAQRRRQEAGLRRLRPHRQRLGHLRRRTPRPSWSRRSRTTPTGCSASPSRRTASTC